MKRLLVLKNSHANTKTDGCYKKQQRRSSIKHVNLTNNFNKRRHLSNRVISSWKKRKPKKRSSLKKKNKTIQRSRKSSSHRYIFPTEITLPNWERISPNIDKILSDEHTKAGVYAHEIHLIQQELEALLSMSLVRENILQTNNIDDRNLKIEQHQQAELVYSLKHIPNKPPSINQHHQQQQQQQQQSYANSLLDRHISLTPLADSRIDGMWSDINTYYHEISSYDISTIKNLVDTNEKYKEKLVKYKNDYQNRKLTQVNITEQLKKETLPDFSQTNPLITHYTNRTTIERFQNKLYEYALSPYKASTSNLSNGKSSTRLRGGRFPLQNIKSQTSPKQKTRSANDTLLLKKRIELVHDYLIDQHPSMKVQKKRKTSNRIANNHCTDMFESKLSTIISLLEECSSISSHALERAHLQATKAKTWQKLNTIQHDLQSLVEKIEMTGDYNNNINTKKTLRTLENLLKNWNKYEDEFEQLSSNYV